MNYLYCQNYSQRYLILDTLRCKGITKLSVSGSAYLWPGEMRLFGWEATLGYGWSGSEPQPLEPTTSPAAADMELTPERKATLSQVSVHRYSVGLAREGTKPPVHCT